MVGSSLIEKIPLAALAGVMFALVIDIFDWSSFRRLTQVPKVDAVAGGLFTAGNRSTLYLLLLLRGDFLKTSALPMLNLFLLLFASA